MLNNKPCRNKNWYHVECRASHGMNFCNGLFHGKIEIRSVEYQEGLTEFPSVSSRVRAKRLDSTKEKTLCHTDRVYPALEEKPENRSRSRLSHKSNSFFLFVPYERRKFVCCMIWSGVNPVQPVTVALFHCFLWIVSSFLPEELHTPCFYWILNLAGMEAGNQESCQNEDEIVVG